MKILFLPGLYPKVIGSAKSHLRGIAYNFPPSHEVTILVQLDWKLEDAPRVRVVPIDTKQQAENESAIGNKVKAISLLTKVAWRECREGHFDLIYARDGVSSLPALILSKMFHIPFVVEVNGSISNPDEIKNWASLPRPFLIVLGKLVAVIEYLTYRNASKLFVCTSGNFGERIRQKYKLSLDRVTSLPNGADTELFAPTDQEIARNKLGLSRNFNYITFVGFLSPWQGLHYLIGSAPQILASCPHTRFIIVGDGAERAKLIKQSADSGVQDAFIFARKVPYEEVPSYINAADLCVAPFTSERNRCLGLTPLKLFEYMACGKPVVTTQLDGLINYFREAEIGITVPTDNPSALAKAIIKLLEDKPLREKMGREARRLVEQKYSWKIIAQQTAEECDLALNNQGNRS